MYRSIVDNSRNAILVTALCQGIVFGSIFYVLERVLNSTLPSIRFYNLIHAVVALQGKLLLALGWQLSHLVKKGFAAIDMQHQKKGIPLTNVAFVDPEGTDDLSTWVDANNEFATIYEYGLPMTSGIIGGTPPTPDFAPSVNFLMEGPAITYMVEANCDNATVSYGPNSTKSTSKIIFEQYWGSMYTAGILITFPAGTHNWDEFSQYDLTQECQFSVVSGSATIVMVYVADVWGNLDAVGVSKVIIGNYTLTEENSVEYDFGTIHHALGSSETLYSNITRDIALGVQKVLNSTDLKADVIVSAYAQIFVCGVLMMLVVTCAWFLIVGGGDHIDRCVQMIDDPLRTMYYMRDAKLIDPIRGNDIGRISLEQHLKKVNVRFGESKATRGNEVGTLTLNEPSKVVKLSRNRTVV
ncbi:hypothetical protein HDU98_000120 [Podochytrium sp. JEL0797]|nr:hypothetical protein HDU98_000120 [Podochytrium sp. JEL0797]